METENAIQRPEQVEPAQVEGNGQKTAEGSMCAADDRPMSAKGGDIAASLARIEKALNRIVDHLYLTQREEQVREFSLRHLAGALCTVVSVVFIVVAILSLLRTDAFLARAWATVAFLGAIAMQGLSLTLYRLWQRR
jgi:hypothetical protein